MKTTETLLAYPEDQYHETHYKPQKALLALADLMHSHNEATFKGRAAGASLDNYLTVQPDHMAYLLELIANAMTVDLRTVQSAMKVREKMNEISQSRTL